METTTTHLRGNANMSGSLGASAGGVSIARTFIAEKAIPDEVLHLVRDFATKFQTRVKAPYHRRDVYRRMPKASDLREGDEIYFRRDGMFGHETGWDKVTVLGPWRLVKTRA